jgi:hypothetical protein
MAVEVTRGIRLDVEGLTRTVGDGVVVLDDVSLPSAGDEPGWSRAAAGRARTEPTAGVEGCRSRV